MKVSRPFDETARLFSLHTLQILDTPPEERFDRITRVAKRAFDVEICSISFIDLERQWFKSNDGFNLLETPRNIAFCALTILNEHVPVVNDASQDSRFSGSPLVVAPPYARFYAGCPVHGPMGKRVGTLCLIDSKPRSFTEDDRNLLRDLASVVDDELTTSSLVTVDKLTRIANRRGFVGIGRQMLSLCRRTGVGAELLHFDLLGLDAIADAHGREAADALVREFASLLVKTFRSADVIARLSGREFVVLLTATSNSTEKALERFEYMAGLTLDSEGGELAWSVGKVVFNPDVHDSIDSLIAAVEARLYDEKLLEKQAS